jgi:MFS family permease
MPDLTPLIETKFNIPPARPDLVVRARLHSLLEAGTRLPLLLVSAPPGFGKTTLVAAWLQSQTTARAWLSLDEADNQPVTFWRYLAAAVLFALGNSSDAFLLVQASRVGFSPAALPLLWCAHHAVKTLVGAPGGALSDRLPRRLVVAEGWGAYALAYLGFAFATTRAEVAGLFLFYALYHGLAEAAERALVADLVGPGLRGKAFGWFHGATGLAAFPASLLTGWLWQARGPTVALATCAAFAAAAALLTLSSLRSGVAAAR